MQRLPFQLEGVAHLANDRVRLLADDMGLGKTCQAIGAFETHDDPVTIAAPAMLVAEWREEIDRWFDVPRDIAIVGAKKGPDPATAGITITSYDRMARPEIAEMLRRRRRGHWIFDEAQYLKEPTAQRAIMALGDDITRGLVADAARVSFLTGTPAPNDAGELWQMLRTAGRYSGSHYDFVMDFCKYRQTQYGIRVTGYKDAAGLRQLLDGFMLRRTDAVVLPPSTSGEIIVTPDEAADRGAVMAVRNVDPTVSEMIKRAAKWGDFDKLETPHLASIRRAVGLAKAHSTAKKAADLLAADPDAKIVLFAIHRSVIEILFTHLIEFSPVVLAGGIPEKKRKASKDLFQNDPDCRVAVCQMKAAGTGLTLTAGNHLWIVEPSWTPADNDQARRRIARIGQKRATSIQFVTLENSIDAAVNEVLRKKRQLIDQILNPACD